MSDPRAYQPRKRSRHPEDRSKRAMSRKRYERATFLKDRALEMVIRNGTMKWFGDDSLVRKHERPEFIIVYADAKIAQWDEFHHLSVYAEDRGKVFSVVWKSESPDNAIVTFKRGAWEEYFVS
jgi:hypothetical protein